MKVEAILLGLLLTTGCSDSSFSGGGSQSKASPKAEPEKPSTSTAKRPEKKASQPTGAEVEPDAWPEEAVETAPGCKEPGSKVFPFSGSSATFTIPEGCRFVSVKAWGAAGAPEYEGSSAGGAGGFVEGRIAVTAGEELTVEVGGGGHFRGAPAFGGGGATCGGTNCGNGGGGKTAILRGGTPLAVAGGGGGHSACGPARGGAGGGAAGQDGESNAAGAAGKGATGTRAGANADGSIPTGSAGGAVPVGNEGGAGGGGLFGGGAAGGGNTCGGGGGGGSGLIPPGGRGEAGAYEAPANADDPARDGMGAGIASQGVGKAGILIITWGD